MSEAISQTRFLVSPKLATEIHHRFISHSTSEDQIERLTAIRNKAHDLAVFIAQTTHESREQSLALTKLDEVVFFANAAIARNG